MSASFACVPRIVNSPAHLAVSIFSIDTRGGETQLFLDLGLYTSLNATETIDVILVVCWLILAR